MRVKIVCSGPLVRTLCVSQSSKSPSLHFIPPSIRLTITLLKTSWDSFTGLPTVRTSFERFSAPTIGYFSMAVPISWNGSVFLGVNEAHSIFKGFPSPSELEFFTDWPLHIPMSCPTMAMNSWMSTRL